MVKIEYHLKKQTMTKFHLTRSILKTLFRQRNKKQKGMVKTESRHTRTRARINSRLTTRKKSKNLRALQTPYAEVCTSDDTDEVALFNKKHYNVAIIIELISWRMCPVNCLFNTGTGPNLLRENMNEAYWMSTIRVSKTLRLRSATSQKVEVVDIILFHVRMGESCVRVMFGIFRNLTVSVRLGTFFIEKFVKRIFPPRER